MNKAAHLLTDDDFVRRLLQNWVCFISLTAIVSRVPVFKEVVEDVYFQVNDWMLATAHQYAWWSLLGLLSSSCCALQLILNSMSMGCAGFNTVLGPIRPTLLALTIVIQMGTWYVAWSRPWQWAPTALSSFLVLFLSFLPELLNIYTFVTTKKGCKAQATTMDASISTSSLEKVMSFQMTSVGCSACMTTVASVLNSLEGVKHFEASIEKSLLHVTCTKETTKELILESLNNAGFPMDPI